MNNLSKITTTLEIKDKKPTEIPNKILEALSLKDGDLIEVTIKAILMNRSDENQTSKEERDKARILMNIIKELSDEYGGKVPINALINKAINLYNMREDKINQIITKLKQQGIIFEPSKGYIKAV